MRWRKRSARVAIASIMVVAPMLMGQRGGCGGTEPVDGDIPDMAGQWELSFNDDLSVEINVGGEVYNPTLAGGASSVSVVHDGEPVDFVVDCARELVVCPSELLPMRVSIAQSLANRRQISLEITEQECRGTVTEGECSDTVITSTTTRNGTIAADGTTFDIVLGGGALASNGCALLSLSIANGSLLTSGTGAELTADEIVSGSLITAYGGGCLLVEDVDLDPAVEAAAAGGAIELRSTYSAVRTR